MRNSDRAWVALAGGVAAYDLIATDDEQLTNAARRYFKSQPIATASMILATAVVRPDHADVRRESATAAAVLVSPKNRTAGQPGGCDGRSQVCRVMRDSRPHMNQTSAAIVSPVRR
jgi:hypothetical protein